MTTESQTLLESKTPTPTHDQLLSFEVTDDDTDSEEIQENKETKEIKIPERKISEIKQGLPKKVKYLASYRVASDIIRYLSLPEETLEKIIVFKRPKKTSGTPTAVGFFGSYHKKLTERRKEHFELIKKQVKMRNDLLDESTVVREQIVFFNKKEKQIKSQLKATEKTLSKLRYDPVTLETQELVVDTTLLGVPPVYPFKNN